MQLATICYSAFKTVNWISHFGWKCCNFGLVDCPPLSCLGHRFAKTIHPCNKLPVGRGTLKVNFCCYSNGVYASLWRKSFLNKCRGFSVSRLDRWFYEMARLCNSTLCLHSFLKMLVSRTFISNSKVKTVPLKKPLLSILALLLFWCWL